MTDFLFVSQGDAAASTSTSATDSVDSGAAPVPDSTLDDRLQVLIL